MVVEVVLSGNKHILLVTPYFCTLIYMNIKTSKIITTPFNQQKIAETILNHVYTFLFHEKYSNFCLIKYRQPLILTLYMKHYSSPVQSALCSDQSHFSRFECYPKKDKDKNILILFGYSAKPIKSRTREQQSYLYIVKR